MLGVSVAGSAAVCSSLLLQKGQQNQRMLFLQLVFTVIQVSLGGQRSLGCGILSHGKWILSLLKMCAMDSISITLNVYYLTLRT